MYSMEDLKKVNDYTSLIANTLGRLYSYGMITTKESLDIIKKLNDKQYEWMKDNFSFNDIIKFVDTI